MKGGDPDISHRRGMSGIRKGVVMFQDFEVDILGSVHKVCFVDRFPERLSDYEDNAGGLCNRYNQEIFIKRCNDKDATEEGRE